MLTNNDHLSYSITPHNTLAEEIIIGSCLYDSFITEYIANHYICSELFTIEKHQIIYINNLTIYKYTKKSNIPKLINILWSKKLLSKIGGIKQILQLIQKSSTIFVSYKNNNYLQYFLDILHHNYTKRLFIQYSYSILQISYKTISNEYIYNISKQYLKKITKIIKLQHKNPPDTFIKQFLFNFYLENHLIQSSNILSGFIELDTITKGFKQSDLIIVAGRPSMGKTSLALNITNNIILKQQLSVYIFSLEMSKHEILDKILSIESNIKIKNIQNKIITNYEWKNLQKTCKLFLTSNLSIDDKGNASIEYIKSQIKNHIIKKSTIIIDYLQLIKFSQITTENRSQEIGYITRELKLLAKTYQSPFIVLSQLNRNIENRANKRPLLSDLRESGCISCYQLPNNLSNTKLKKN